VNIKRIIRESIKDFSWAKEVPSTIIAGSCIKSSKGVDWTIEHIDVPRNTVIVRSKKGHGQIWDLTALYIQNKEGKLKLCTGETAPPNSVPTPDHLQYPKDVNESNDMKWIEDTNTALNMDTEWVLVNDIDPSSSKESEEIQKTLFNLGYNWNSGGQKILPYKINSIHHFLGAMRGLLTFYKDTEKKLSDDDIENSIEENIEVIYWSDIKPNKINESDLDWVKDVNPYRYNIGDTIEPINGYHYYVNTVDYVKMGRISGYQEATVMNIIDDFYEVKLNYNYLSKDIRERTPSYYLLIDEIDKYHHDTLLDN